jgi:aminoglycoside phosphotransferase (APT) family kinase protein
VPVAATFSDADLAEALTDWLRSALSAPSLEVVNVSRPSAGASNETAVLEVAPAAEHSTTEKMVCRIQPDGHQLFLRPDAVQEGRVIRAVANRSAVPVPRVIAFEPTGDVLGAPLFVMSYVEGRVLPDIPSCHRHGWLLDCSSAQRAMLWDNGLREMVRIANVPTDGLMFLPDVGLSPLVANTRRWFDWARRDREFDVLSRATAYLERHQPDSADDALNWGDARVGNIIFSESNDVAAVIDWEMASIGPAEVDLGWWLMMDEFYSTGLGVDRLPGVPDEQTQVHRWQELIGRAARDLDYFKILAALRFAVICARTFDRFAEQGLLPLDSAIYTTNPVGLMLYRWLGEPVPQLAPEYAALLDAYSAAQA